MSTPLNGKTVLIVDDEEILRFVLCFVFQKKGCNVLEASNGVEAFELVKSNPIDIVITDIRMPGGDGIALLENIKSWNVNAPIVFLVTGFADISEAEAYRKGANGLFSKPYELAKIVERAEDFLNPSSPHVGRRESERVNVDFEVAMRAEESGQVVVGKIVNLSQGGMFVTTDVSHSGLGEKISFEIKVSKGDVKSIRGSGRVRWNRLIAEATLPIGCGIEFVDLAPECLSQIMALINIISVSDKVVSD